MKKQKLKKLKLNRAKISSLTNEQMNQIEGGRGILSFLRLCDLISRSCGLECDFDEK